MEVLVACEESQTVCIEFRRLGHEAYSNDIQKCSGGHREWHIQADCRNAIQSKVWGLIIFHPDCTAMAVSGNRWYGKNMPLFHKRSEAIRWTVDTWNLILRHSIASCLENPVSVIFSQNGLERPQYIQPWQFGHGETKKTGLKLRNLPRLVPTNIVSGREHRIWKMPPSENRKKLRSKTFPGVAKAMARQWGALAYNFTNPQFARQTDGFLHPLGAIWKRINNT